MELSCTRSSTELPTLDDELAGGLLEYDTLEEFKESIRKNNREQLDKQQDDLAVENALGRSGHREHGG